MKPTDNKQKIRATQPSHRLRTAASASADQIDKTAAPDLPSLGEYINSIIKDSPNDGKKANQSPVLKRGCKNRILLYNGCFNPPHLGHLAHLQHAFKYCRGFDFPDDDKGEVVGAIVLVAPDHYLKWKLPDRKNDDSGNFVIRLSEAQRIALWKDGLAKAAKYPIEWCWVFSEGEWLEMSQELERLFADDGVDVEFVRLAGGDRANMATVQHGVWGCRTTVTTDISRPVDFYTEDENGTPALRMPRGHLPWGSGGRKMTWPRPFGPLHFARPFMDGREVWTCTTMDKYYQLLFIASLPKERLDPDLSSTRVREVMSRRIPYSLYERISYADLERELKRVALGSKLLAAYVEGEVLSRRMDKREQDLQQEGMTLIDEADGGDGKIRDPIW